jgi:hypothetical protein
LETGKKVIGRLEIFYYHEDWTDIRRLERYYADWKVILDTGQILMRRYYGKQKEFLRPEIWYGE